VEQPGACRVILLDLRTAWQRTARARRAGLAKAEPGAGSAGRGAAQRRRLDCHPPTGWDQGFAMT
jgi:hypothetical protein